MTIENERMRILDRIESGEIGVDEGLHLIEKLGIEDETSPTVEELSGEFDKITLDQFSAPDKVPGSGITSVPGQEQIIQADDHQSESADHVAAPVIPPDAQKWRSWWMIPFWIGMGITGLGGLFMSQTYQSSGFGFWFVCAAFLLLFGLLIMMLAWQSRTAPWLHLRINQKPGERPQRIAFSFPIPIRPAVWFIRVFGNSIPRLRDTSLDEILLAVGESTSSENPISIQVDEGEDGEKVEIYIG